MKQQLDIQTIDKYSRTVIDSLDFTGKSEDAFYNAVDLADFRDKDAETIFSYLKNEIRLIPFGDYLKRYIFLKAGMTGNYNDYDLKEYQQIIVDSFAENYTPKSFTDTSTKLSALAKNWLTQAAVNRDIVFLLGFGLNMAADDVSGFLTKAISERDINFKDPLEIIYWYCYNNCFKFPKMLSLKEQHDSTNTISNYDESDKTIRTRNTVRKISDDESLLKYLAGIKKENVSYKHSLTVDYWFSELYSKSKSLIADFYTSDEREKNSDKVWLPEDITEGDLEKVLCCGIPVNLSGNLEKLSSSRLKKHFVNKRFSRQHISELLSKKVAIDRFDLITLNFFLFSQKEEFSHDNKTRYVKFVDCTNDILNECMMGELYVANPYECFLLMCILSDCPLATYADVWEMSFSDELSDSAQPILEL